MGRQCPDVRFSASARAQPSTFEPTDLSWRRPEMRTGGPAAGVKKLSGAGLKLGQSERLPPAKHRNRVPIIQDSGRISEALTINVYSWSCA